MLLFSQSYGQKQSLYSQYPSLAHQDVMNDEYSTRSLGGVPTAITYSLGKASFNGTTSNIAYRSVNGVKSVRLKLTLATTTQAVLTLSATHSISVTSGTISATGFSSPTIYVNGAVSSTITTSESEIVITTATAINANTITLGKVSTSYLNGSVNEFDLGNRALSASEVKNLYDGTWNKDLTLTPLISFDSRQGTLTDKTGKTIINTSTTVKRAGSIFSANFNGATSKLNYGNIDALTGDITIAGWVKMKKLDVSSLSSILHNTKIMVFVYTNGRLSINSDGNNILTSFSANNAVLNNKEVFFSITRTSTGIVNFYIGDYKNNPALSGSANQASGTPASGTNFVLGTSSNGLWNFNGLISQLRVYKSILTQAQISQLWSSTANQYIGN